MVLMLSFCDLTETFSDIRTRSLLVTLRQAETYQLLRFCANPSAEILNYWIMNLAARHSPVAP